jgi:hypothetical protein
VAVEVRAMFVEMWRARKNSERCTAPLKKLKKTFSSAAQSLTAWRHRREMRC